MKLVLCLVQVTKSSRFLPTFPDEAIQLAKISVLLHAIDGRKLSHLKLKCFDEFKKFVETIIAEQDKATKECHGS